MPVTEGLPPRGETPTPPALARSLAPLRGWEPLYAVAAVLVTAACAWWLLKELGGLLRPLVLAVLLSYVVLPVYGWLKRRMSPTMAVALLATVTAGLIYGLALLIFTNVVQLNDELPELITRGRALADHARDALRSNLPAWMVGSEAPVPAGEAEAARRLNAAMRGIADNAAGALGEAVLVGFYMIFLLIEVRRFPSRIRAGFSSERAERIMTVVNSINRRMVGYIRVKALASLCLAVPQALILWGFGVRFAVMWGLLAFVGNFIPYLGSLVALIPPMALAFLDLEPIWRGAAVAGCLLLNQFVATQLVEPLMTARAVDLSPLVVLFALSFWGLAWGLTGMLLAVPLTVMLKIVWENTDLTRPLARLMSEK